MADPAQRRFAIGEVGITGGFRVDIALFEEALEPGHRRDRGGVVQHTIRRLVVGAIDEVAAKGLEER